MSKAGTLAVAVLLGAILAGPAWAEHGGGGERGSVNLDVDIEVGRDGFRLGGVLSGLDAVYGAWLNGALRPRGFSLDGRVQGPGRPFTFKLDADLDEWLPGWVRRPAPPRGPEAL